MLLRVILRQLRPSVLCQRVSYHSAAGTNLLRRCPSLLTTQPFRALKKKVTVKVTADAIDGNSEGINRNEKELLLQENDPEVFVSQEDDNEGEGDVAEANYSEHQNYVDLIIGHLKKKRLKEAIDVMENMIKEGVKPTKGIDGV